MSLKNKLAIGAVVAGGLGILSSTGINLYYENKAEEINGRHHTKRVQEILEINEKYPNYPGGDLLIEYNRLTSVEGFDEAQKTYQNCLEKEDIFSICFFASAMLMATGMITSYSTKK